MSSLVESGGSVAIIADEWSTLDHARDSTLMLLRFAHATGCFKKAYWLEPKDLIFKCSRSAKILAHRAWRIEFPTNGTVNLSRRPQSMLDLSGFSALHWRMDPPVTLQTFSIWQALATFAALPEHGLPPLRNSALGLLAWNEKYSIARYADWCIPSVFLDADLNPIDLLNTAPQSLGLRAKNPILIKDAFEAASRGVRLFKGEHAKPASSTLQVIQNFSDQILKLGETRAFVVNGKLCAWLKKFGRPPKQDPIYRFEGGFAPLVTETKPTVLQKKRARAIAKDLLTDGIHFATIDFIGSSLLEINVTSPGLLWALSEKSQMKVCSAYWEP